MLRRRQASRRDRIFALLWVVAYGAVVMGLIAIAFATP